MTKKITKAELIQEIQSNTNLPKKTVVAVVDSMLSEIKNALCNGSCVELRTFGTFELCLRKGRKDVINPKTGEKNSSPPHYVAAFKAGQELKNKIWSLKV